MNHMHLNRKWKTVEISHYRERDLKSDITSLDLRYNFCTDCSIFLSEISWLETEIPKNVQEGTNTMSVFIKCNGSPGSELGYAGEIYNWFSPD